LHEGSDCQANTLAQLHNSERLLFGPAKITLALPAKRRAWSEQIGLQSVLKVAGQRIPDNIRCGEKQTSGAKKRRLPRETQAK